MTPEEIDDQAKDNPTPGDPPAGPPDVDEWISLREALRGTGIREPIPIVQVVMAVEDKKCFFRDRFGRIKKITDDQIEMVRAALEKFDEYEHYPDLYSGHPPIDSDTILEDLTDFGWPGDRLPALQPSLLDLERPLDETERKRLYRTIYSLAKALAEKSPMYRKSTGLNVDRLSQRCYEVHSQGMATPPRGYSKSTFRNAIDEAIKACQEELDEL